MNQFKSESFVFHINNIWPEVFTELGSSRKLNHFVRYASSLQLDLDCLFDELVLTSLLITGDQW